MRFLINTWRRIGPRLYLALGFAVFLTLVSSAVGVYHFERSGDLSYRLRSESVPALEATWTVARESERLRALGLELLAEPYSGLERSQSDSADVYLQQIDDVMPTVIGIPALDAYGRQARDAAYDLAEVIDQLVNYRDAALDANAEAAALRAVLEEMVDGSPEVADALGRLLQARDEAELALLWAEFEDLAGAGADPTLGQRVYVARGQQLALRSGASDLGVAFDAAAAALEDSLSVLLTVVKAESAAALDSSVHSFDQGRILLAAISVASVAAATLTAWLWVGQGVIRRLSQLSERIRGMASGDLESPIPEARRDEIGELAGALDVWRRQALEVQRLNLVERLYGELREAHDELRRMQGRLVAQGKLAALGELVSGVAHEISNPLNFVQNFAEGSLELYDELIEMLQDYRDRMSEEDVALLNEISEELTNSLERVRSNSDRAFAIVERMRGLGVVGGEATPSDLNAALAPAVRAGCDVFMADWEDITLQPILDLDDSLPDVPLVEQDFREAIMNLVSNSCYAMRVKHNELGDSYQPVLTVSTRLTDNTAEVRVRDNGTGIADEVIGQIFNPFFSTREGLAGAGLGLSIAADVARRLGGELTVDTVFGEYAEFIMTLPTSEREQPV